MSKPLLFLITPGGTSGDRKPLAILSVLAAYASLDKPVTFAFRANALKSFAFIEKLARYLLGTHFRKKLILHMFLTAQEYKEFITPENLSKYCIFSQASNSPGYGILLDFGDNAGTNRFTSKLLTIRERLFSNYFGSLFLPDVGLTWSNMASLRELRDFRQENVDRKIMLLAGSLNVPFSIESIVEWVEKHADDTTWAFILVNYKTQNMHTEDKDEKKQNEHLVTKYVTTGYDARILIQRYYTEFEDVMPFVDFVVTNCGAGSVTVPLAYGKPQTCRWDDNTQGTDKKANSYVISDKLEVGPTYEQTSFSYLMNKQLATDTDFHKYVENAKRAQTKIQAESAVALNNMVELFAKMSSDSEFQNQIQQSREIPKKYALE